MIRFNRGRLRDKVLDILEGKQRVVENRILREIPYKLCKKRLSRKNFAVALRRNSIKYRWTLPERLFFMYKGRRYSITLS